MVNRYPRTGQYPKRVEKLVYLEAGYDWSAPVFFKAFGEWAQFINTWIELKRRDGTIDALHGHWILGKHAVKREPRWSVIRNVLHWVD